MKTNKSLKLKLTLAIRAAMSPQALTGAALVLAGSQSHAAVINVGGACTLVRAIVAANNDTTATGHCPKGLGPDTIVLPPNSVQTLTAVNNTNYGPTGLPTIRTQITIQGNGSRIQRVRTAPAFHIFSVAQTGRLTLQKATVTGSVSGRGSGALYNNAGILNVNSSTISGNTGCGISNAYESGPGDRPLEGDYSGRSVIANSIISGNTGCGIRTFYTERLTVANSTISNNKGEGILSIYDLDTRVAASTIAGNGGSGVEAHGSYVTINNSTISGNSGKGRLGETPSVKRGGGIYIRGFTAVVVTNSTISGNSASLGGGIYISGFFNYFIKATLINSTITGNTATSKGGGVFDNAYYGSLEFKHTILSGNSAPAAREVFVSDRVELTTGRFNVFGFSGSSSIEGFTLGITDIVPTQPLGAILNPRLANNGGPTQTHALVAGSPAIDAINDGTCPPPAKDQRGVARPQDGNGDGGPACNIGSYEFVFTGTTPVQTPPQPVAPTPLQPQAPAPTQPGAPAPGQPQEPGRQPPPPQATQPPATTPPDQGITEPAPPAPAPPPEPTSPPMPAQPEPISLY